MTTRRTRALTGWRQYFMIARGMKPTSEETVAKHGSWEGLASHRNEGLLCAFDVETQAHNGARLECCSLQGGKGRLCWL